MSKKNIEISEYVYDELTQLRDEEGHTSYDSVLRTLLGNYEG
jgi:predicted CopG family antitoxin